MGKPAKGRRGGARQAHVVRIVGGQWRSRHLPVLSRLDLRPSPDRVRESLFNWLGQHLTGWHCADVFAGTGVLGFEAASRGAASVLMVEQDAALVRQLEQNRVLLQAEAVRVLRGDALLALQGADPRSLDLVFLDPPFEAETLYAPVLTAAAQALHPDGFIYLEARQSWPDSALAPAGLRVWRHLKAGRVHAHLLRAADGSP